MKIGILDNVMRMLSADAARAIIHSLVSKIEAGLSFGKKVLSLPTLVTVVNVGDTRQFRNRKDSCILLCVKYSSAMLC